MSMVATAREGAKFEPAPKGTYLGVIKDVVMHESTGGGQFADSGPQVKIVLLVKRVVDHTPNRPTAEYPNPKPVAAFIDQELHTFCQFEPTPKNRAGRWIDAVRGRPITPGEQFDWHSPDFLGQKVKFIVSRSGTGGQKITEIDAYHGAQGAAPAPAPQTTTLPQPAAAAADPWDAEPVAGGDEFDLPF